MDINEQLFEIKKPYLKTINCLDKGFVRLVDWMGSDQRIVQAARVSYGDGTKTVREDKGLIDYLMRHAHTSPFEQVLFNFHVKMPIFVARQIVRHRTACLSGETLLWFDEPAAIKKGSRKRRYMTINDFYKKWHNGAQSVYNPKRKKTNIENIVPDKYYTVPELSKIIDRCTEQIRTWLAKGLLNGTKMNVDKVTKCSWRILGKDWINFANKTRTWNNSLQPILSQMNLRMCDEVTGEIKHTNIKDIWSNGFKEVFEVELENGYVIKMTKDHLCFSENGWGTLENLTQLKVSDKLNCSWSQSAPSFCVNGVLAYQDYNWLKDKIDKLKRKRVKMPKKLIRTYSKIKNIKYAGVEEVFDIEVVGPFHNFVANGFIVHNSLNEISGRYSILKDEFYEPDVSRMVKQSKDNKQGSSEELLEDAESILQSFKDEQFEMYDNYQEYIQGGMAKEMARINLPLSIYTEWYITFDLHNLFHFLKLRMDSHAQYEVREFANAKYNLIKDIVPFACEAFDKHVINGRKFSADEMEMIKIFLTNEEIEKLSQEKGWKDSKLKEFLDKL